MVTARVRVIGVDRVIRLNPVHVRSGSISDVSERLGEVRSSPNNGHVTTASACLKSAKPGLTVQQIAALFDHLVGARKQCRWHKDAKRLCGLQIDHQIELGRLFDRQVGRLRTHENLVDEDAGPAK
jgi:hypothetical protein